MFVLNPFKNKRYCYIVNDSAGCSSVKLNIMALIQTLKIYLMVKSFANNIQLYWLLGWLVVFFFLNFIMVLSLASLSVLIIFLSFSSGAF